VAYDPQDASILGLIVTHGTVDFGDVDGFTITPNIERATLDSIRTGKQVPVRRDTIRTEVTIAFTSRAVKNASVLDLWAGSAGGGLSFDATEGPMVIKMPGPGNTEGLQLSLDNASISGNGFDGEFGSDYMGLTFEATALIDADAETLGTIALLAAVVTP
jgi:hypothetical protein